MHAIHSLLFTPLQHPISTLASSNWSIHSAPLLCCISCSQTSEVLVFATCPKGGTLPFHRPFSPSNCLPVSKSLHSSICCSSQVVELYCHQCLVNFTCHHYFPISPLTYSPVKAASASTIYLFGVCPSLCKGLNYN